MTHAEVATLLNSHNVTVIKTTTRFGKVVTSIAWTDYLKIREVELPYSIKLKLV